MYFFAGSSPFVKHSVELNESDKKLIDHLADRPIEDIFKGENPEQDPLEMLEKFQTKLRQDPTIPPQVLFNELHGSTQMNSNIGFKKYIRRWSNWVIDFNWIYSLKFFLENLHENKMFYLVKNYPILDNFILHWMWWSYSLNKDMEFYTKDAFRGVGSMPWLINDDINNNNKKKKNLNKRKKTKKTGRKIKRKVQFDIIKTDLFDSEQFRIKLNKRSISLNDLLYEKESERFYNEKNCLKFDEISAQLKQNLIDLNTRNIRLLCETKVKSKSIDFSELTELKIQDDEENQEDLEITIVYLDKDKTKVKSDKEETVTNETTSVFDKFLKSFSSGQITSCDEIKKENSFDKLIDFLKSSNRKPDQGLVVRVSDYSENAPVLDSAPTVEQIETEIFSSKPSTDSSDLIKLLLKIDKHPIKIPNLNPPIFEILKSTSNPHTESCLNKILTTPINIDIVSQLTCSSSSSGFSSSSISPLPLSSNPSPNSSNSSTAKPNIDSSFSTSCSSKSQVSSSSLSLSSSSSSVSIESNGNKQNEKHKEETVAQKDLKVEDNDNKIMSQSKGSKFKPSKSGYNKIHYQKNQMNRVPGSGYQNRSFNKHNFNSNNSSIKQYSSNFRAHQYQNRQFLNVQSKFPKSNSLPCNGKNSNPFSSNYVYAMPKSSNPSIAQTSQSTLHWQSNFLVSNEHSNQFNFQNYKNPKFRNQFNNSNQSLRCGNNEKAREHTLMPLLQFQNMYTNNGTSSSSSSTPSASFSSSVPTPSTTTNNNSFTLPKPGSNLMQNFNFKKPQSTSTTNQMGQMNQRQQAQPMSYNLKKSVKK